MSKRITFYSQKQAYGEFSNFSPHAITVDGVRWPTVEHFFQAQKFAGTPQYKKIRQARSPAIARKLGRSRKVRIRRDWEAIKLDVMRKGLRAKFTQHEALRRLLLDTRDATLVEHVASDSFWGDGGTGRGKNWLGRLLMELRASF